MSRFGCFGKQRPQVEACLSRPTTAVRAEGPRALPIDNRRQGQTDRAKSFTYCSTRVGRRSCVRRLLVCIRTAPLSGNRLLSVEGWRIGKNDSRFIQHVQSQAETRQDSEMQHKRNPVRWYHIIAKKSFGKRNFLRDLCWNVWKSIVIKRTLKRF